MRDKLIELIKKGGVIIPETAEAVADYLIANNVFVLPDKLNNRWELVGAFLMRLFVADEAEIEKIKGEFELQEVKKILTDIRDYLVDRLEQERTKVWCEYDRRKELPYYDKAIAKHDFIRSALADLTEYAEKLGVEL